MRVVIDEDIPASLTPRFRAGGHTVNHVEDIGLKGKHNGVLLAAISDSADILVTGDTNLGHQQNLKKFDLAIILVRMIGTCSFPGLHWGLSAANLRPVRCWSPLGDGTLMRGASAQIRRSYPVCWYT